MFPGAGASVYRNEDGEPLGWDYPDEDPRPDTDWWQDDMDDGFDREDPGDMSTYEALCAKEYAEDLAENVRLVEEAQLQRLEDTDPSTDDGRWGGDYCVHGQYVGTPGGADYICGLCEEGLTFYVKDPAYELAVRLDGGPAFPVGATIWPSNVKRGDRWALRRVALLKKDIRRLSQIFEHSGGRVVPSFEMRLAQAGRWEDPNVPVILNIGLRHIPEGASDIEAEVARILGIPADAVYFNEAGDMLDRGSRIVITGVECSVNRNGLTPSQLHTVAAFEVQE